MNIIQECPVDCQRIGTRATRKPSASLRYPVARQSRSATRQPLSLLSQPPPRATRPMPLLPFRPSGFRAYPFSYQSRHHSQTFPLMSQSPSSLDRRIATGCVLSPEFSQYQATSLTVSLPANLYPLLFFPPRAAYSHCASVGSVSAHPAGAKPISFNFRQNTIASIHDTCATGKASPLKEE